MTDSTTAAKQLTARYLDEAEARLIEISGADIDGETMGRLFESLWALVQAVTNLNIRLNEIEEMHDGR